MKEMGCLDEIAGRSERSIVSTIRWRGYTQADEIGGSSSDATFERCGHLRAFETKGFRTTTSLDPNVAGLARGHFWDDMRDKEVVVADVGVCLCPVPPILAWDTRGPGRGATTKPIINRARWSAANARVEPPHRFDPPAYPRSVHKVDVLLGIGACALEFRSAFFRLLFAFPLFFWREASEARRDCCA